MKIKMLNGPWWPRPASDRAPPAVERANLTRT
jgi:hypothetical protein